MAEYNPSFPYQSKIVSSEVVNNDPQTVISQADQSNTMGSVAKKQSRSLLGSLPSYGGVATLVDAVISGGLATYHDILTNPEFQCSLVNLANQFSCGNDLPSCPSPKDIIAIKQEGNSWIADCGCPDTTSDEQNNIPEPDDNDILSVQLGAEKCLQPLNLRGNDSAPWDEYSDIIEKEIEGILNNPELSPNEKYNQIRELLNMLTNAIMMNGWDVDYGPGFEHYQDASFDFLSAFLDCVININDDCALNQTPSATVLKLLLKGMSRKPEKTCKEDKELNDQCECVCPSGTTECGADGKCMECPEGATLQTKSGFFSSYCECSCPEGTVETFVGDPNIFYPPPEFGGPTPEEYRARNYACLPPCPEGMVREKGGGECKCRKNTGSWLFPKFELVPADGACNSSANGTILDGYKPNPKNNCECECVEPGYEVHIKDPVSPGNAWVQRCRPRCPDSSLYDWDSDSCICPETTPCPAGQSRSPNNGCNCSSGSYSYTSLTIAELKKIASSGYNLKSDVELL